MPTASETMTMDLENLQQKQSNLVIQYKQAVSDYLTFTQSTPTNSELLSIQGRAFAGTGSAGQSTATTLQDCQAACSANKLCSGATFVSNQCVLRTGDTPLVPANQSTYAIIPKKKQLLLNMESLNAELIAVNQEIQDKIASSEALAQDQKERTTNAYQHLTKTHEKLHKERSEIRNLLQEYETIEANVNETDLKTTQRHYTYVLLVGLTILVVIVLAIPNMPLSLVFQNLFNFGKSEGSQSTSGNMYFVLFGIIVVLVLFRIQYDFFSVYPLTEFLHMIYRWLPRFQIQPI